MHRLIAVAVGLGAAATPAAADVLIRIEDASPPGGGCERGAIEAAAVDLLARDPFHPSAPGLVRISIASAEDDELWAEVAAYDARGQERGRRLLVARDCDEMARAIALVIALVLSEDLEEEERALPLASEAPPEPPSAGSEPPRGPAEPERSLSPNERASLAAVFGAAVARSGEAWTGQLLFGGRARLLRASLGLEVTLRPAEEIPLVAGRVRVSRASAALTPCVHVKLALCGHLAGGWIRGQGMELSGARSAATPVVSAGARLGWELAISREFSVLVYVDMTALLTTTRFLVDERPVWISPPHEAILGLVLVAQIL